MYRKSNKIIAKLARLTCWLKGAYADKSGASAIMFGLLLPALLGFSGLAIDAVFWVTTHNKQQSATDQAAITATHFLYRGARDSVLLGTANEHLARLYVNEFKDFSVQVNNPPSKGTHAGDNHAVEVIVSKVQPAFFAKVFGVEEVTVKTRAVSWYHASSDYCLLALHKNIDQAITLSGSIHADLKCGIASNSDSMESIYLSGSAWISSPAITAVGDIMVKGSASLNDGLHPLMPYSPPITDPYGPAGRNLQVPNFPTSCKERNTVITKDTVLEPGRYCGGIHFSGGNITLKPGTYIIDKGSFKATGGTMLTGEGVTIVLTGSGNNYAGLDIAGNTSMSLHAPTTDPTFKGILFFQDPEAPDYQGSKLRTNKILGNADIALSGAIYFPKQEVVFSGGANGKTNCLQLVANQITITGQASITNSCDLSNGTDQIARLSIKLVE
ncbi:MAG: hypothetical protein GY927_09510 [bacterium]|nr:hypothetical protein [bacterium]